MTPRVLFFPSQQLPRKSPKLPARRADVTAAGRTRPRGFVLLFRRSVQNPSILTVFSVFLHFPQAAFPTAVLANTSIFRQRSRTAVQRPVFGLPAGTRSAGRRKRHKPPTRARQTVTGVLSALSTCVFNKIGIFSSCRILVQFLHLSVIVLLECRLNWSDGKSQIAVARFSIFRCDQRRLCDEQVAFFE